MSIPQADTAIQIIDAATASLPDRAQKATGTPGQEETLLCTWEGPGGATSGIWECTPGTFSTQKSGVYEVSQIIAGRATVTSADGSAIDISAGSLVILPDGWSGQWQVHETIRKTYTIVPIAGH